MIEIPFTVEGGDPSSPVNESINPRLREVNFALISSGGLDEEDLKQKYDLESKKAVWLVLHGWNSDYDNFVPLAETMARANPEDIILLLDWVEVSHTAAGGERGGNFIAASWIRPLAEAIFTHLENWGFTQGDRLNLIGHSLGTLLSSEIAKQYEKANYIIALDPASELNKINLNQFFNGYDLDYRQDGYNDPEDTLTPFRDVTNFSLGVNGDPSIAGNEKFSSFAHHSILMDFGQSFDFGEAHGMVLEVFQNLIDPDRVSFIDGLLSLQPQLQDWREDALKDEHEGTISVDRPEDPPQNPETGWQSEELPDPNYLLTIDASQPLVRVYGTDGDDLIDADNLKTPVIDLDNLGLYVDGGQGDDFLRGSRETLWGLNGENTLTGGSGDDTLVGNENTDYLQGNKGKDQLEGGKGGDRLDGGFGDDFILGQAGDDQLIGKDGSDILDGGTGVDILLGGLGHDLYIVDSPQDMTLNEQVEGGNDTIEASVNWALGPQSRNIENLRLIGSRFVAGIGNLLDNEIRGSDAKNRLSGGRGNDTLTGERQADRLIGNDGNDWLSGGFADDLLEGGEGRDIFKFDGLKHGLDTVVDFNATDDSIVVSRRGFSPSLDLGLLQSEQFLRVSSLQRVNPDFTQGFVYAASEGNLAYLDRENQIDLTPIANLINSPTITHENISVVVR